MGRCCRRHLWYSIEYWFFLVLTKLVWLQIYIAETWQQIGGLHTYYIIYPSVSPFSNGWMPIHDWMFADTAENTNHQFVAILMTKSNPNGLYSVKEHVPNKTKIVNPGISSINIINFYHVSSHSHQPLAIITIPYSGMFNTALNTAIFPIFASLILRKGIWGYKSQYVDEQRDIFFNNGSSYNWGESFIFIMDCTNQMSNASLIEWFYGVSSPIGNFQPFNCDKSYIKTSEQLVTFQWLYYLR